MTGASASVTDTDTATDTDTDTVSASASASVSASVSAYVAALCVMGCGGGEDASMTHEERVAVERAIAHVIDDWHAAAAAAQEDRYFAHLADDAVFLGTDATERWDKAAFRAYAHPHFARGRAWAFRSARRAVTVDDEGRLAWFDEDLTTQNLGPCRGSGVLRRAADGAWKIVQYNLAVTIPNDRFAEVKALLEAAAAAPVPPSPP